MPCVCLCCAVCVYVCVILRVMKIDDCDVNIDIEYSVSYRLWEPWDPPPPPKFCFPPSNFFFLNSSEKLMITMNSLTLRLVTLLQNQHFSSSGPSIPIHIKA